MSDAATELAALQTLDTDLATAAQGIIAKLAQLETQLATPGVSPASLVPLIADMRTQVTDLVNAVTPPAPVTPAVTPPPAT